MYGVYIQCTMYDCSSFVEKKSSVHLRNSFLSLSLSESGGVGGSAAGQPSTQESQTGDAVQPLPEEGGGEASPPHLACSSLLSDSLSEVSCTWSALAPSSLAPSSLSLSIA